LDPKEAKDKDNKEAMDLKRKKCKEFALEYRLIQVLTNDIHRIRSNPTSSSHLPPFHPFLHV
jgi:hypothetical protein